MLELQEINYYIKGRAILNNLSITITPGEVLAIIGANGAGKTSLLSAILNDITLTSGSIFFNGQPLQKMSTQMRARHIAALPQFSVLNFPYLVEEVVLLGRTPHSTGIKTDNKIVHEAMEAFDVAHLMGQRYTDLSGGEKRRTQLARVMTQIWRACDANPRILILDEPTSSLDLGHKQQIMTVVEKFAYEGVAVILVEHDLNIVAHIADTILALQHGQNIAYGPVQDCLTEEIVKRLFNANVSIKENPRTWKP
jgi:iron complex transport system ATP-binding protein